MKQLFVLAAVAAAMPFAPAYAQVMSPAGYVKTAGASDLYEIMSSKAVLETTQNPQVRDFAQKMVDQHMKTTATVKAAAMRSGLKPAAPMLTPLQKEMIAELRSETGPARDATYIAQQKAAHAGALDVQTAYAMGGNAPALKAAAAQVVPVVKHHIMMLKTM